MLPPRSSFGEHRMPACGGVFPGERRRARIEVMGALRSLALIAFAASASAQPTPVPPPQLACLPAWYAVRPALSPDGKWVASFPDGSSVPFDDGVEKTFEKALES